MEQDFEQFFGENGEGMPYERRRSIAEAFIEGLRKVPVGELRHLIVNDRNLSLKDRIDTPVAVLENLTSMTVTFMRMGSLSGVTLQF